MSFIEIILGPTNTGKTFYAFEQMFLYKNGESSYILNVLEKLSEIYAVSSDEIALITGEEKIIPKNAKYFLCTIT